MRPITEQHILLTGSTAGFGEYVANKLAERGTHLHLHGRNPEKLNRLKVRLAEAYPRAAVDTYVADFADLGQVRAMADRLKDQLPRLDVLINNAGIGFGGPDSQRQLGREGHELRLTVNYLAPYLLTEHLLPVLRASAPARIVNVASLGQESIESDDLMLENGYTGVRAYRQSKLAMIAWTIDLAENLAGSGVTANSLHPATFADTQMVREAGIAPHSTVAQGGEPILHLAVSDSLDGATGKFYDQTRETRALAQAYDNAFRSRLRERTRGYLAAFLR